MAVQIGSLRLRDVETNATSGVGLVGAFGVYTLRLGSKTYAYVAGHEDDSLSVFVLRSDGSLDRIQTIYDGGTPLELNAASQIVSAAVDGTNYLYVNAAIGDGLSVFRVHADGTLTNIQNVKDDDILELNGPEGKMAVAIVGGVTYLVSPGDDDNGLGIFRINADGTLTSTFTITDKDAEALQLHSASDAVVVVADDGHTYTYVAGEDDPGISAFRINTGGTLTNTQNIPDDGDLMLGGTAGLAVAALAGVTYVVASGAVDNGLSVFAVGATGQLSNVFNLADSSQLGLAGAMGLTSFCLDGESFLAVSATVDDALSIFHMAEGGSLTEVTTLFDNADITLDRTYFNSFATVGGTPYLLVTGRTDNGVTVFGIGSGNDILEGTRTGDLQLGLAGNDVLKGRGGKDDMNGGSGNDILKGGAGKDWLNGGTGDDRLLGGQGRDRLVGGEGRDEFVLVRRKDSGPTRDERDVIEDFGKQDTIVLTQIDAVQNTPGNQSFRLDRDGSFSAGEIWVRESKAGLLLKLNLDQDKRAEMSLLLKNLDGALGGGDFAF